ncbi:MAG: sorbosone dehydrogenase family protein [Armatimonadetes bacterium]|nr:sorbosone dehydrogenase family protein [Armatimonadota bacterium]
MHLHTRRIPGLAALAALTVPLLIAAGCRDGGNAPEGGPADTGASPRADGAGGAPGSPGPSRLPVAERLKVPDGFRIEVVTDRLAGVRLMAWSPDGRLFATQPRAGQVTVVPVGEGNPYPWATGLNLPHGIAFHEGYLYIAETNRVVRWPFREGQYQAPGRPEPVAELPGGGQHWTRTLHFGPDGKLYVAVGSSCNICTEEDSRRAAILQFEPDGGQARVYASGLRNTVDFTWDQQGRMWGVDNGTDRMGDEFPPEELNLIREGGFYGWPYAHGDRVPDPRFGERRPEMVAKSIPPAFTMPAHAAPLGIAFVEGDQFPADYRGDLFVALHGSWDRSTPVGYKVIRIHFENGMPVRATDFITGFGTGSGARARPVGVIVAPDGSLLVSDDKGGHLFRVRDTGSVSLTSPRSCSGSPGSAPGRG